MRNKIHFEYPIYPDLTHPLGPLPRDKRAQACWYFYLIAQMSKELVGDSIDDQTLLDNELWMDAHYEQQARSVALMYQLESPDEMFKFWPQVTKCATQQHLPTPAPIYMKPLRPRLAT